MPHDLENFKHLLGDGSRWGISIEYAVQPSPDGFPQAFAIGEKFMGNDSVALILGDNIFYSDGLSKLFQTTSKKEGGATVFGY